MKMKMKIILISDIKSKKESIIPYGLNLGKFMESEVDILHAVDTRTQQGVSSSYADSKSISPGEKLPIDKIILREKEDVKTKLDKILSREASKLNYPLKINTIVEEDSIENKLRQLTKETPKTLVLINSEPDDNIFQSKDEIVNIVENTGCCSLIIPPAQVFQKFKTAVISTDFSNDDFESYAELFNFLYNFKPIITAVDIENNNYATKELQSKAWLYTAKNLIPELMLTTNILRGKDYIKSLAKYVNRNNPDLLILFKRKQNVLSKILQQKPEHKLIKNSDIPVLYYP